MLKPEWMILAPLAPPSTTRQKLTVELISGHHLPKPGGAVKGEIIDPFVKIAICGDKADEATVQSKVIYDNGFDPHWDETFEFSLLRPELATLLIIVMDKDITSSDFIGQVSAQHTYSLMLLAHAP